MNNIYAIKTNSNTRQAGRKSKPIAKIDPVSGSILYIFSSLSEANSALGLAPSCVSIRQCCNGSQKSAYGYIWKYIEGDIDSKF
jgi:hypothetical protein